MLGKEFGSFGHVTGCFYAIRGFLGGFFAELKELAGATHVLQSETGGAEEADALTLLTAHISAFLKFGAGVARIHSRSSLVCRTDGRV